MIRHVAAASAALRAVLAFSPPPARAQEVAADEIRAIARDATARPREASHYRLRPARPPQAVRRSHARYAKAAVLGTTGFIVPVPYMEPHALRDAPISVDR
jgi:hypothetical protein